MISASVSEDDLDLVALAARSMAVCGVARAVSEVQPELLIAANQQQLEQPQQGVGQAVAAASSWGSLGLSSFLQVKDELILQLPSMIGRVLGEGSRMDLNAATCMVCGLGAGSAWQARGVE